MSQQYNHKETKAVHAGVEPDLQTGAVMTPVYQTSTYYQKSPGDHKGYEYSRTGNPTRTPLEKALAELENAKYASVFGSGMAAIDAIIRTLNTGDHVICTNDLYGGSYRLFTKVTALTGIEFSFIGMQDVSEIEDAIKANTKMVWMETPTNPLMNILDIRKICALAKSKGLKTVVDNTFASPMLQNPINLGADIVLHSITKYINGHSDVVMGCVITNDEDFDAQIKFLQNTCGAVPGPWDCFLVLRGIKTLALRMEQHSNNGEKIAQFLNNHSIVEKVLWPGLQSHPNHEVAAQQMHRFGGMMSIELKGGKLEDGIKFLENVKLFTLAESLGGVESLIGHPASMTHAAIPREERLKAGLSDSLVRLSVGIENADDLIADLDQALNNI